MVQSKILSEFKELMHYFGDKSAFSPTGLVTCEQVHGGKIAVLASGAAGIIQDSDGLVTDKQLFLGIRTADCLPVLLYEPLGKIIGAVHAGWKGLDCGIIGNSIKYMIKLGADAKNVRAAIGPHIQTCCYKVSADRIDRFKHYKGAVKDQFLDLGEIARQQLTGAGLLEGNLDISDICTSCDASYWSFRRDKKVAGRMMNVIGLKTN